MKDAYTAGVIDGEGTVTLICASQKYKTRVPCVMVTSTTKEILEFLQANYGGCIVHHQARTSKWKESWAWKITNQKAIDILQRILPYMIEPEKVRRAKLIVEQYKLVTTNNGYYTPEARELKYSFEKEFFKNSKKVKLEHGIKNFTTD